MTRESNRIPSLDGLCCIAVSMALLSHLLGTRGLLRPSAGTFLYEFGNLGVKVFFVISGCLITNLLLHELEKQTEYISESFTLAGPSEYFRRVTAWCATGVLLPDRAALSRSPAASGKDRFRQWSQAGNGPCKS
jgi:peptidoglycan/LPS O-acetylase OafA/YrhL